MKAGSGGGPGSRLGMPIAAWPEADHTAWTAAFAPALFCDAPGAAARMAPNTKIKNEICYARFLVWLKQVEPASLAEAPAARVTEARVLAYLHMLKGQVTLPSVFSYACRLLSTLEIIAPNADWSWFGPIIDRIDSYARLLPHAPRPLVEVTDLLDLGHELMATAEAGTDLTDVQRAELYRNGLAIAFLAARPLRRNDMINLVLGRSVIETGTGYAVLISAEHTKTRMPLDFSWPDDLVPAMRRYLTAYRPVLAAGGTPVAGEARHLWLARSGAPLPSDTFADMISRHTLARFGERLTPHAFRHCAATAIATSHPEEFGIIHAILGHTTMRTSERHYVHAKGLAAANAFQAVLAQRRKERH